MISLSPLLSWSDMPLNLHVSGQVSHSLAIALSNRTLIPTEHFTTQPNALQRAHNQIIICDTCWWWLLCYSENFDWMQNRQMLKFWLSVNGNTHTRAYINGKKQWIFVFSLTLLYWDQKFHIFCMLHVFYWLISHNHHSFGCHESILGLGSQYSTDTASIRVKSWSWPVATHPAP